MCGAGTYAQPRYVDAHIHWDKRANFVEDLVRIYRKNNAVACLSAEREEFDALKAAAKKHPDIIIPFYWIDLDDSDVLAQIDRAHTAGFKGLKIHSPLKNYDDAGYFPAFERAERYRLVALLHTGSSSRPNDKIPRHKGSMARAAVAWITLLTLPTMLSFGPPAPAASARPCGDSCCRRADERPA